MLDPARSVHLPPFDYGDLGFRTAAVAVKARSHGHCQVCGRDLPLEAHHWHIWPYPPAHKTTADDLTGLCRGCHDRAGDLRFYLDAGGDPERLRIAHSELIATLLHPADDGRRIGRVVSLEGQWVAIIGGVTKPSVGEVFWLLLRSKREWRTVAVIDVIDGRPGHWRVHKQFLGPDQEVRIPLRRAARTAPYSVRQTPGRPERGAGSPVSCFG